MLKKMVLSILTPALSIYLTSLFMDSMQIASISSLLIISIFLGALNLTVKPILKLISLPITIISLGLFSFVINGIILYLAFLLAPNAYVNGLFPAIIGSIFISIINVFLDTILD